ncbi:histidine kinase [Humibacter sp.]|uniref:sensor histidine kinase n=1 Tax=Humibacter sp. TaxID=1940291 RepID=UPI003F7DC929
MGQAPGLPAAQRARVPWTTVAVALLGAAALVSAVLLIAYAEPWLESPGQVAVVIAVAALQLALAGIVAKGAPSDVTAPLLASIALVLVLTNCVRTDALGLFEGAWMLLYLPLALVLLVVPAGRPASAAWRAVASVLCGVVGAFVVGNAVRSTVAPESDELTVVGFVLLALFFVLLVACTVAPFARYRRAGELERIRLRWVLVAGLSLPLTLLLCWASYLAFGTPDLVGAGLLVMFIAIPTGATIALTRPQLFDVDRAAVSTVTALALIAAALLGLSIASAAAGTGMDEWPAVVAATVSASTALAGVIAFPFARRGFDRLLYPERARSVALLRRLSSRVDAGLEQPEDVQRALRESLRDPGLIVAYRRFADRALVGLDGKRVTADATATTVRSRGEEIGAIVPSAARAKRPAAAIARATAPLLDAVRLRSELTVAAAEVEASRERMLRAGYEERRRLERDLHDGAQQRLVALGMQLRVLQRGAGADDPIAASLDEAVAQLGTAVAELRQLAHGVRPSALDDGLAAALSELERLSPQTIELDVRAGELPDAVATTAYFVVNEAVANALRHAEASSIRVVVRHENDELLVRVSDDGRGGAAVRTAGGLTGLSDRVSALGGRLSLHSSAETGTTVEASLPCGS